MRHDFHGRHSVDYIPLYRNQKDNTEFTSSHWGHRGLGCGEMEIRDPMETRPDDARRHHFQ